jgi:23S rRNA (pseudouridine1915-N3)-methyltransferase
MKISIVLIGKTAHKYLNEGIKIYDKRLQKYIPCSFQYLPDIKNAKNLSATLIKEKEGDMLLQSFGSNDYVVLLDENGKTYTSVQFAKQLQHFMNTSVRHLKFVIGGAYGFSQPVYQRANAKMSLSNMTFSHQMVRLIFIEQLYRGFSILNNEPYHHV